MDFLNSVFARPREGTQTARRAAREANPERNAESGGEEDATQDEAVRHPLSSWMETSSDTPVASPVEGVAPEAASMPGKGQTAREEPPPGEELPPGEERPGRRTP